MFSRTHKRSSFTGKKLYKCCISSHTPVPSLLVRLTCSRVGLVRKTHFEARHDVKSPSSRFHLCAINILKVILSRLFTAALLARVWLPVSLSNTRMGHACPSLFLFMFCCTSFRNIYPHTHVHVLRWRYITVSLVPSLNGQA